MHKVDHVAGGPRVQNNLIVTYLNAEIIQLLPQLFARDDIPRTLHWKSLVASGILWDYLKLEENIIYAINHQWRSP